MTRPTCWIISTSDFFGVSQMGDLSNVEKGRHLGHSISPRSSALVSDDSTDVDSLVNKYFFFCDDYDLVLGKTAVVLYLSAENLLIVVVVLFVFVNGYVMVEEK
jgi:hypothetical protein